MTTPSKDSPTDKVSKVTFSPVSDSAGTQALIVTIKTVTPQAEDLTKIMEKPRRSLSFDSRKTSEVKRRTRSRTSGNTKSTMTEQQQERSFETQTSVTFSGETSSPSIPLASTKSVPEASSSSVSKSVPEAVSSSVFKSVPEASSNSVLKSVPNSPSSIDTPCLKHAAENISRKASDIESEKVSMCNSCSKSMLSYIFVVQDFLESLAKEIVGNSDPQSCVQCLRQETRKSVSEREEGGSSSKVARSDSRKSSKSRSKDVRSSKREEEPDFGQQQSSTRAKETPRDVRRYEETSDQLIERSLSQHRQTHKQDNQGYLPMSNVPNPQGSIVYSEQQSSKSCSQVGVQQAQSHISSRDESSSHEGSSQIRSQDHEGSHHSQLGLHQGSHQFQPERQNQEAGDQPYSGQEEHNSESHHSYPEEPTQVPLRDPVNRQRSTDFVSYREHQQNEGNAESSSVPTQFTNNRNVESSGVATPFSDGVDGIVSTLSNAEREVYDSARDVAGWEGGLSEGSASAIASEAYVTMCRNNAEALGCLVLGTSLLLTRTSRTLCVLVSDGVSNAFRGPLSSVFHVVQLSRSLDSLGSTKLALLEQPELGVSFEKLNVWRLLQFTKCVYLNPDTLVVQNCDELFCRNELSAVADVGWPDCFNSGVFVFVPSLQTFWQLIDFAEKQGSYDGGDQGLLNSYFNSWSEDINKKLSFIYNLMANVSYTYTPAFKQFGRSVKVVQFHGSSKPWHVKFFSRTGQISPESPVHPTYAQFVHVWINIFRISALRQLSQEIRSYAQSQEIICAVELLRFFPLPTESEAEFFLTPPSVRLRLTERRLQRLPQRDRKLEDIRRRKSAEFPSPSRSVALEDERIVERLGDATSGSSSTEKPAVGAEVDGEPSTAGEVEEVQKSSEASGVQVPEKPSGLQEVQVPEKPSGPQEDSLPGSEVGNYQGMKAWEQGRMDYQGTDSSDTIIKRLQFLMEQPK